MTDRPDRQDGDAGTILQIGGAGSGRGWGLNAIEVRESTGATGWRWRKITDAEQQRLVDALNSKSPTRDGAEGAESKEQMALVNARLAGRTKPRGAHVDDYTFAEDETAPPKPAPDAMREALQPFAKAADMYDDIPGVVWTHGNVELWQQPNNIRGTRLTVDHLRAARAAISAPVPPADEPDYEAAARALGFVKMEATAHWIHPKDDFILRRCYTSAEAIFNRELPGLLSPSPALTAEPVTHTVTDEQWNRALSTAYSCLPAPWCSLADFDNAMQHAFGMLSLKAVATPPVRGDRETIARSLMKSLWCGATWDDASEFEREAFLKAADALPVQPGAGEREMIERHAQIADRYDGWQAENIAAQIRSEGLALSRQAPHSSSKKGTDQ